MRRLCFLFSLWEAVANAAAPGRHVSGDYLMAVDGRDVDVIRVPMPEGGAGSIWNRLECQPYSYAAFTATGAVEICVRSGLFDLSKTEILPVSKGVVASSQSVDTVVFRMTPPQTLVLEPRGRHRALVVSANLPEADPPREGDPKVKWFGPGFHRADLIALGDGETLYLAPGAWVEGFVLGRGRDIAIRGSGVLSGACWDWHKGPSESRSFNESGTLVTLSGENVTVRDATLFSSWGWSLVLNCVTNALVDNVKVVGGRVINDDGIDVCRARDVVVRNSFVRSQDDALTPKYWCENLVCTNLTLWTDAANAFRTGYECEPGESGLVYRNLLFKDIDVLHLALNKTPPGRYWANCAIYIQPAHGQPMYDTLYEDIRFHEVGPKDIFLNVKTMPITQGSTFCRTDEAGTLKGLTLRNIRLPDSRGGMCVNLSAHDDAHPIEGVRFENVTGYGPVTKSGRVEAEVLGMGLSRAEKLRRLFLSGDTNYVFVASHRMDWRNHPENSLSGAKSAIAMGVDILEIDPAITMDNKFVLLHDAKLDRTTDGTGWAWDATLDEIRAHRLRANMGGKDAKLTDEPVASLEEVLLVAKDRCLVNIDKFAGQSGELLAEIRRLGMERQVICKSGASFDEIRDWTGEAWGRVDDGTVIYMPIVNPSKDEAKARRIVEGFRAGKVRPPAYEVCFNGSDPLDFFAWLRTMPERPRIWINTMWTHLGNGHTREPAEGGYEEGWDWFLAQGATALQTDRPAALVEYLGRIGRHDLDRAYAAAVAAKPARQEKRSREWWRGRRIHLPIEEGEFWWGTMTAGGRNMPFSSDSPSFRRNLARGSFTNQTAPLLVSSHGRWIWCESPFLFWKKGKRLDVETDGEHPIQTGKAGETLKEAFVHCSKTFFPASGKLPDMTLVTAPQYNTWIELNYHQNQKDILAYARAIRENGFPAGVIMVDDTWQADYGVWEFDPAAFADPKAMCDELHSLGFRISLWICPFVSPDSRPYRKLRTRPEGGLILRKPKYGTWIQHWWNGESAIVDFLNPAGVAWFKGNLTRLQREYGVDGFKFDAGDVEFYSPEMFDFSGRCEPVRQCAAYADIGLEYPLNEYRACWKRGGQPLVQRLNDKACSWEDLRVLIPDMIAAGLIGCNFVCPDMIGGGLLSTFKSGKKIDQELFVRSAQVHALCPMMQFSAAPWRVLDKEHLACVKAAVDLRQRFVPRIVGLFESCAKSGEPILRNLEYEFPGRGYAEIKDEFLLGNDLLVAPVLEKGVPSRKVVIPPGTWKADDGRVLIGPCEEVVDAPLGRLPHFER